MALHHFRSTRRLVLHQFFHALCTRMSKSVFSLRIADVASVASLSTGLARSDIVRNFDSIASVISVCIKFTASVSLLCFDFTESVILFHRVYSILLNPSARPAPLLLRLSTCSVATSCARLQHPTPTTFCSAPDAFTSPASSLACARVLCLSSLLCFASLPTAPRPRCNRQAIPSFFSVLFCWDGCYCCCCWCGFSTTSMTEPRSATTRNTFGT